MNGNSNTENQQSSEQKLSGSSSFSTFSHQLSHQIDPQEVQSIISRFILALTSVQGEGFIEGLKTMQICIQKGYSSSFIKDNSVCKKLMKQFSKLAQVVEKDPKAQGSMLYILSIMAMLMKEVKGYRFPFVIKFLKNLFLIDRQLLQVSSHKNNILAILGVIYENLSNQTKLIRSFGVVFQLKQAILSNYSLIQELYTIKLFNRTIYTMIRNGERYTSTELKKYGLVETISKFISKNEMNLFMNKLEMALIQRKSQMIAQY